MRQIQVQHFHQLMLQNTQIVPLISPWAKARIDEQELRAQMMPEQTIVDREEASESHSSSSSDDSGSVSSGSGSSSSRSSSASSTVSRHSHNTTQSLSCITYFNRPEAQRK